MDTMSWVRNTKTEVFMKKSILKRIRKGSMTIEAAAVMPIILLVLFASIYLCFYVHNRTWLTSAAYEAALAGSMEGVRTKGKVYETASTRSRELGSVGFFGAENLSSETIAGKNQVQVVYDLDTISSYGAMNWHLHVKAKSKIIRPVKRIRQIKAAAEMFHILEG